jgi:hypothetical protein
VPTILVGSQSGLLRFDTGSSERQTYLDGRHIDAIAPAGWKRIWAVVDGDEIWRCDDLADPHWSQAASLKARLRGTCLADTRANEPEGILVGASEAHLVRVTGTDANLVESFEAAPGRDRWYTPWGGPPDVRSITENRDAVFVNVHVGGILRSRDGGGSWQPTIDIHADVHRVVTGGGRVYAAGARGLSVSDDDGDTWRLFARGLHATYCRSVAVCGSTLLLSASDGPGGGRAALYRSGLEGERFERCRIGLPEWFEGNIDSLCLDALPDGSFSTFASESGSIFTSSDEGSSWSRCAKDVVGVSCVLALP